MSRSTYYDGNVKIYSSGITKYDLKQIKTTDFEEPNQPCDSKNIEVFSEYYKMSDGTTTGNIDARTFILNVGASRNNFKIKSQEDVGNWNLDYPISSGDYVFHVRLYWDASCNLDGIAIYAASSFSDVETEITHKGKTTSKIFDDLYFATSSADYAELSSNTAKVLAKFYFPTDWTYEGTSVYGSILLYLDYKHSDTSFKLHMLMQAETLDGGLYNEYQVMPCKCWLYSDELPSLEQTYTINSPAISSLSNDIARQVSGSLQRRFCTR